MRSSATRRALWLAVAFYAIPGLSGSIAIQEAAINRTIIDYELNGQAKPVRHRPRRLRPHDSHRLHRLPRHSRAVNAQQFYNIPGSASEFEEAVCAYIEDHGGTVTSVETISES